MSSTMKTVVYVMGQCTWGFLQTRLGFAFFLAHAGEKHFFYHGAVVTGWKYKNSASLGLFLFLSDPQKSGKKQKKNPSLSDLSERLLVHEYGHTVQSLMLGPLYLILIALPSALWCSLPYCKKKRERKGISYYSFFSEKWADRLGEKVLGRSL